MGGRVGRRKRPWCKVELSMFWVTAPTSGPVAKHLRESTPALHWPEQMSRPGVGRRVEGAARGGARDRPSAWGPNLRQGCASSDLPKLTEGDTSPKISWFHFSLKQRLRSVRNELFQAGAGDRGE